jgi:hypothetical protein
MHSRERVRDTGVYKSSLPSELVTLSQTAVVGWMTRLTTRRRRGARRLLEPRHGEEITRSQLQLSRIYTDRAMRSGESPEFLGDVVLLMLDEGQWNMCLSRGSD